MRVIALKIERILTSISYKHDSTALQGVPNAEFIEYVRVSSCEHGNYKICIIDSPDDRCHQVPMLLLHPRHIAIRQRVTHRIFD